MPSLAERQTREHPSVGFVEREERFRDMDMRRVIEEAGADKMEFVCYYIGGQERATLDVTREGLTVDHIPPISVVDLQMTAAEWTKGVVGRVSPWIHVDSEKKRIRELSERCLVEELNYMKYMGLGAMMVELRGKESANLARVLQEFLWGPSAGRFKIWVVVPLLSSHATNGHNPDGDHESQQGEEDETWLWWYQLRTTCGNSRRLGLCLRLTADMPEDPRVMDRWLGEPLASIRLDTSLFMTNRGGWPVLSEVHQSLVKGAFAQGAQALLSGRPGHAMAGQSLEAYMRYLDEMWQERTIDKALLQEVAGYHDFLQVPLQPLSYNLESAVYEVFETDPVKYKAYGEAIYKAMRDLVIGGAMNGQHYIPHRSLMVVMILGAGRGPLVREAIQAYRRVRKDVDEDARAKFYVVEKNPNAIPTLRFLKEKAWAQEDVTVVNADMRQLGKPPFPLEKADLVISELLGSFGDNELSPECLDGAEGIMKKDTISIPKQYTSYLAPIHSPRLHATVRDEASNALTLMTAPAPAPGHSSLPITSVFDKPYVVLIHNRFEIQSPKPVFTFLHPKGARPKGKKKAKKGSKSKQGAQGQAQPGGPSQAEGSKSNERETTLSFQTEVACELIGFAGYFDTELYTDVKLSILPETHSPGMFSWFPAFFPLRDPVKLAPGDAVTLKLWRRGDGERVWYEWCLLSPHSSKIQNAFGASSHMNLH